MADVLMSCRIKATLLKVVGVAFTVFYSLNGTCQSYIELADPEYGEALKCFNNVCFVHRVGVSGHYYTSFGPLSDTLEKEIVYETPQWYQSHKYYNDGNNTYEIGIRWGAPDTMVYIAGIEDDTVHHVIAKAAKVNGTHYFGVFWKLMSMNDTLIASGTAHYNEPLATPYYEDLGILFYDPVEDSLHLRFYTDTHSVVEGREIIWNPHRNSYNVWFQGLDSLRPRMLGFYELDRQFNIIDTFFVDSLDQRDDTTRLIGVNYFLWASTVLTGNHIHQLICTENHNAIPGPEPFIAEYMLLVFNAQTMEVEKQLTLGKEYGDAYAGYEGLALWEGGTYATGVVNASPWNDQWGTSNSAMRVTKLTSDGSVLWQNDYVPDVPKNYVVYGIHNAILDSALIVYGTVFDEQQTTGVDPFFFMIDPDGNVLAEHSVSIQRDIALYPNPADDFITLKSEKTVDEITMADLHGRVIMKRLRPSSTIDVRDLPAGVYLLHIRVGENVQCRKVVIR